MQIANRYRKLVSYLPTAKAYIQNGLIAMWDGIENAGWGIHDANATTWKNLTGNSNYDFILKPNAFFQDSSLRINNIGIGAQTAAGVYFNNYRTLEIVYKSTSAAHSQLVFIGDAPNYHIFAWYSSDGVGGGRFLGRSGNYTYSGAPVNKIGNYSITYSGSTSTRYNYYNGNRAIQRWTDTWGSRGFTSATLSESGSYKTIGNIYCLRLYNRELTQAEISANYQIDKTRFGIQ